MAMVDTLQSSIPKVEHHLKQTFEQCAPEDRLDFHRAAHSVGGVTLAKEVVADCGGSVMQQGAAGYAFLYHDYFHLDETIKDPLVIAPSLLRMVRKPINNGEGEIVSTMTADYDLTKIGVCAEERAMVAGGIYATMYKFENNSLVQPYVLKAPNKLVAFAVAKTDLLAPLAVNNDVMQKIILRFFVEQYPYLSMLLHDTDEQLPHETFHYLKKIGLKKFVTFEHTFIDDQVKRMNAEASELKLTDQHKERLNKRFDAARFKQVINDKNWDWIENRRSMTETLRQAVAY